MDKDALDTLRQLKEWLDAGTITQQEFDTLKQKLIFNSDAAKPDTPRIAPIAPPSASVATPAGPPAAHPSEPTFIPPVEEPLLPPLVHHPVAPTSSAGTPAPPYAASGFTRPSEASHPGRTSPASDEATFTSPTTYKEEDYVADEPYVAPAKSPLAAILIVGGIVALLGLVAYLMFGGRESERLTSTTLTAADTLAVQPEAGPQAEQIDLPPAAAPETVRVAPVIPVTPSDSVAQPSAAPTEETAPPTPAVPDAAAGQAAEARIQSILNAYYTDMQAAPFAAATYFAPKVERFYTMQNTTPGAINDELTKSHFPEFLEAESQIEPGTLKVSEPVNDGSRVVTYLEKSKALRQSMQKHQQTTAQVRVRFDRNFKIIYLRQEKLLENTFSE